MEKATQIDLEGRINAGALHTIIYLGPAASTGPEPTCLATLRDGTFEYRYLNTDPILTKEWFTHVWVFQDLVFSSLPMILCGRTRIKGDILVNFLGTEHVRMPAMQ